MKKTSPFPKPMHPVRRRIMTVLKQFNNVTTREMMELADISSPSVVLHHLRRLQKSGHIKRTGRSTYKIIDDSFQECRV